LKEAETADFISFLLSFERVEVELLEGLSSLLLFNWCVEIGEGSLVDKITHLIKYYTKMSQKYNFKVIKDLNNN